MTIAQVKASRRRKLTDVNYRRTRLRAAANRGRFAPAKSRQKVKG